MAIDRSKYKSTPIASMDAKDKDLENQLGIKKGGTEFHKFDVGKNIFRIYPVHPESKDDQFAIPKVATFIPAMVIERDTDGKEIKDSEGKAKLKVGVKPVFNSRIHGSTKKDLIEEYITFAQKVANDNHEKEEDRKKFLLPIFGHFDKNPANRVNGITYRSSWIMYTDKIKAGVHTFGKLEVGKSVKERLNNISSTLDDASEPMNTDPFTDIDNGKAVIITYNDKAEKSTDYYKTDIDISTVPTVINGVTYPLPKTYPLTEAQLEAFDKLPPLDREYGKDVFKRKDFQLQLDGLTMLDKKHGLGIFSYDAFLDIVEEIDSYYPEEEEETTDQTGEEGVDVEQVDELDIMNLTELKEYSKSNQLPLVFKAGLTEDMVRGMIKEYINNLANAEPAVEETVVEQEVTPEVVAEVVVESPEVVTQKEEKKTTPLTPQERIALLKKNAGVSN